VTDVDALATEQVRPDLEDLDQRPAATLVDLLLEAEAAVPAALQAVSGRLAAAVDLVVDGMTRGGRLVYVGAGTPGRLAALDAAECPPTFGVAPDLVVAVLAGGREAAAVAVEGAEDDADAGAADVRALGLRPQDVVVGITASGRTPYVLGALDAARSAGCATVAVANNAGTPAGARADVAVEVLTGAEVVAGSTRLTAGTSQKVALNVLSTSAMVRLGKTYGAWMVDVQATNDKLRRRARRIVREVTGVDDATAVATLEAAGWRSKPAIVALLAGVDVVQARARLDAAGGRVREALTQPGAP
jgi:N-acetylmuramic acid 6-phosphate etherase